jgi:hypothetical protein
VAAPGFVAVDHAVRDNVVFFGFDFDETHGCGFGCGRGGEPGAMRSRCDSRAGMWGLVWGMMGWDEDRSAKETALHVRRNDTWARETSGS